jgi:hypothetical protein
MGEERVLVIFFIPPFPEGAVKGVRHRTAPVRPEVFVDGIADP